MPSKSHSTPEAMKQNSEHNKPAPVLLDRSLCPVCTPRTQVIGCVDPQATAGSKVASGPGDGASAATANAAAPSRPTQPRLYTSLWVKRANNGLTAQLQKHSNKDKIAVIVDPQTPVLLLIENELAINAFVLSLVVTISWLALKGVVASI